MGSTIHIEEISDSPYRTDEPVARPGGIKLTSEAWEHLDDAPAHIIGPAVRKSTERARKMPESVKSPSDGIRHAIIAREATTLQLIFDGGQDRSHALDRRDVVNGGLDTQTHDLVGLPVKRMQGIASGRNRRNLPTLASERSSIRNELHISPSANRPAKTWPLAIDPSQFERNVSLRHFRPEP